MPLVKTRLGIGEVQRLEAKSNTERISSIQESSTIIKDHPLLGVGLGNYTHYLRQQDSNQPAWSYQPVHNGYLLLFAELGFIGFIILLIFNLKILKDIKDIKDVKFKILILCLLFIIYYLLLFDHYFLTNPTMLIIYFLILGIVHKSSIDYSLIKSYN